jgi:hypothetical protein
MVFLGVGTWFSSLIVLLIDGVLPAELLGQELDGGRGFLPTKI